MTTSTPSPRPSRVTTIFAVAVLVAGPPLNYLRYHHYPLLAPEVLLPAGLWLLCSIVIGSGLNRAPRPVRMVAFTMLLLLFADLQFNWHHAPVVVLAILAIAVGVWLLERHLETILALALAAFYLAALPSTSRTRASSTQFANIAPDTLLPPVVYLILDEHIGIEGWPKEFGVTREMERRVRAFYLDESFRLYGKAYSEFVNTDASIPAVLNWPVEEPHGITAELIPLHRYRPLSNELFRKLSAEGYRIRVYESTYMDFCDPKAYAVQSCEIQPANSIRNLSLHDDLSLWRRALLVGLYFLEAKSQVYARARDAYSAFAASRPAWPRWSARIEHSEFPAAMKLLDRLQRDIRTDDPRGTLYFAHLLAPHNPYEVDSTCRSQTDPNLWLEIQGTNTSAERALRYDLYAAQVRCLYRHLDALFRVVDSLPNGRRMVIIVHGDHGSRIVFHYPTAGSIPILVPSDFTDGFSALFAIRAPGIPAGYDRRFVPINELVGRALASRFASMDVPTLERHVLRIENGFHSPFVAVDLSDTSLAPARREDGTSRRATLP